MRKYTVKIKPKVRKFLRKLNPLLRVRIVKVIDSLEYLDDDFKNVKKLKGYKNKYRLRIGKYRILFEKYEDKLIILVLSIGTRGDVYK